MSRLCRLRNKSHGEDGQWAYNEIMSLRKQIQQAEETEAERWAKRLEWLADKYDIDCSGLDSGDLLDGVEHTIKVALQKENQAGQRIGIDKCVEVTDLIDECADQFVCDRLDNSHSDELCGKPIFCRRCKAIAIRKRLNKEKEE